MSAKEASYVNLIISGLPGVIITAEIGSSDLLRHRPIGRRVHLLKRLPGATAIVRWNDSKDWSAKVSIRQIGPHDIKTNMGFVPYIGAISGDEITDDPPMPDENGIRQAEVIQDAIVAGEDPATTFRFTWIGVSGKKHSGIYTTAKATCCVV